MLQWYSVKGVVDRGEVPIDAQVLANSPGEAVEEALTLAGMGGVWKTDPAVEVADREDED